MSARPPLRIGFKITLSAKSRLTATNNPLYPLGCTNPSASKPSADDIGVPGVSAAAAAAAVDDNSIMNSLFMVVSGYGELTDVLRSRLGSEVSFGNSLRLIHVATGKLLCINTRARAETEKQNFQISLEALTSEHAVHSSRYVIVPQHKVRSEGQRVLAGDMIVLRSLGGEWFLHISTTLPPETDKILEANASHHATGFKLDFYDAPAQPQPLTSFHWSVRCSEAVQLFHRERGTLVASDSVDGKPYFMDASGDLHDAADIEATDAPSGDGSGEAEQGGGGDAGGSGLEREGSYPSKSLFIVEWAEDPTVGGPVRFGRGKMFRLRHMATGLFLALSPRSSSSSSNNNKADESSAFEFSMSSNGDDAGTRVCFHQASDDPSPDLAHHSRIFLQFPLCGQWLSSPFSDDEVGGGGGLSNAILDQLDRSQDDDDDGDSPRGGGGGGSPFGLSLQNSGGGGDDDAARLAPRSNGAGRRRSGTTMGDPTNSPDVMMLRQNSPMDPAAEATASREAAERELAEEITHRARLPAAPTVSQQDGLEVLKVPYSELRNLHSVVTMIPPLEKLNQLLTSVPTAHRGSFIGANMPNLSAAPPTYLVQHVQQCLISMILMCTRSSEDTNPLTRDGQPDANAQQRIVDQRIVHLVMDIIEKLLPVSTLSKMSVNQIDRLVSANATQQFEMGPADSGMGDLQQQQQQQPLPDSPGEDPAAAAASSPTGGKKISFATDAAAPAADGAGGQQQQQRRRRAGTMTGTQQNKLAAISFNVAQLGFRLMRQCCIQNSNVAAQLVDLTSRILLYCSNPKKKVGATAALVELFRGQRGLVDRPDDMSKVMAVIKLVKQQRRSSNQAMTLLAVMANCNSRGVSQNQSAIGKELMRPSAEALFPGVNLPPLLPAGRGGENDDDQRQQQQQQQQNEGEEPIFFKLFQLPRSKNPQQVYVDFAKTASDHGGGGGGGGDVGSDPGSDAGGSEPDNSETPPGAMTIEEFLEEDHSASSRSDNASSRLSARSDGESSAGGMLAPGEKRKKLLSTQITPPGNLLQQLLLVAAACSDRHEHNTALARVMYPLPLLYSLAMNRAGICGEMRAAALSIIRSVYVDVAPLSDLVSSAERPVFVWQEVIDSIDKSNARSTSGHSVPGDTSGSATDEQFFDHNECFPQLLSPQEADALHHEKLSGSGKIVVQLIDNLRTFLGTVGALTVVNRDENTYIDAAVNLVRACLKFGWISTEDFAPWLKVLVPVLDGRNDIGPARNWHRTDAADERNYYLVSVKISIIESLRTIAAIVRNGLVRVMVRAFASGRPPVHCCAILDLAPRSKIHCFSLERKRLNQRRQLAIARQEEEEGDESLWQRWCGEAPDSFTPPTVDTSPFTYIADLLDVIFDLALYKDASILRSTLAFLLELTNVEYALAPTLSQVQLLSCPANAGFYNEMRRLAEDLGIYRTASVPASELPQLRKQLKKIHAALHATLFDDNQRDTEPVLEQQNRNSPPNEDSDAANEERYNMLYHLNLHVIIGSMVNKVAQLAHALEQQAKTSGSSAAAVSFHNADSFLKLTCDILQLFLLYSKYSNRVARGLMPLLRDFCVNLVLRPGHLAPVIRLMLTGHFDICRSIDVESMENIAYAVANNPKSSTPLAHLLRLIVFQASARDDGDGIVERNQRNQMRLLRVLEASHAIAPLLRPHEFFMRQRSQAALHNMLDNKEYCKDSSELMTRLELLLTVVSCVTGNRHAEARTVARHMLFGKSTSSAIENLAKMLDWEPVVGVPFTMILLQLFLLDNDKGIVHMLVDNKTALEGVLTRLHNTISVFANEVRNGSMMMMDGGGMDDLGGDDLSPSPASGADDVIIEDGTPPPDGGLVVPGTRVSSASPLPASPTVRNSKREDSLHAIRRRSRHNCMNSFETKCYASLLCALPCVTILAQELKDRGSDSAASVATVSGIANDVAELLEDIGEMAVMEVGDDDDDDDSAEDSPANKDAAPAPGARPNNAPGQAYQQQQQQKKKSAPTLVAVGVAKDMRLPSSFFFGEKPDIDDSPPIESIKQVPVVCLRHVASLITLAQSMNLLHDDVMGVNDKLDFIRRIRTNVAVAEQGGAADDQQQKSIQDEWDSFTDHFKSSAAGTNVATTMRTPARLMLRRGEAGHNAIKSVARIIDMPQLSWYERTMYLHFLRQCISIQADPFSDARLILPALAADDGGDAALQWEKKQKLLSIDKSQEDRQTIFTSWKSDALLSPKLMQFLSKAWGHSDESVRAVLLCAKELLAGGHSGVQQSIMNFFLEIQNESFFSCARSMLLAARESVRDRVAMIENEMVDRNLTEPTAGIIKLVSGEFDFSTTTLLLRVAQLMVENHYRSMQMYFLDQWDNSISICLLESMISLLDTLIGTGVDSGNAELTMQSMATLIELVQGPCEPNIKYLVTQGVGTILNKIFSHAPPHLSEEEYRDLCRSSTTLLLALTEGHPEFGMLATLCRSMPLSVLIAKMDEAWATWEESSSANGSCCSSDDGSGDGGGGGGGGFCARGCNVLWSHLRRIYKGLCDPTDPVDEAAVAQLGLACDLFIFVKVLLDNQSLHQSASAASSAAEKPGEGANNNNKAGETKAESANMLMDRDGKGIVQLLRGSSSFRKVNKMVASVEVLRDEHVETAYFRVPSICLTNLTETTKTRVMLEVDRTSDGARLSSFYDRCFNILDEMQVLEMVRTTRVLSLFMYYNDFVDSLALLLAFLINLLIVSMVSWENVEDINGERTYWPNAAAEMAYNVLGWLLVFTQTVLFANAAMGSLRVYLNEQWGEWQDELNKEAQRESKASLSIIPPRIVENAKDELSEWEVLMWNIYFTAKFTPLYKNFFFLIFAFCGAVLRAPYFYCPQLLLIVDGRYPGLTAVTEAITVNTYPLALTGTLLLVSNYIFTIVVFFNYSDVFNEDNFGMGSHCSGSMVRCFFTTLWGGLRSGGGLGDMASPPKWSETNPGIWAGRIFFDVMFFVVMIIFELNLVFGIVLDSFSALREEKASIETDQVSKCFVCGLATDELDKAVAGGFSHHVQHQQRSWAYLYYMEHLRAKDESDHTGTEGYVWELMKSTRDPAWFPIGRCVAIDHAEHAEQAAKEGAAAAAEAAGESEDDIVARAIGEGDEGGAAAAVAAASSSTTGTGGVGGDTQQVMAALRDLAQGFQELSANVEFRLNRLENLVAERSGSAERR